MGADHHKTKVQVLLVQNKLKKNKKEQDIKHGIYSPTCRITKGGSGKKPLKIGVEKIQQGFNKNDQGNGLRNVVVVVMVLS